MVLQVCVVTASYSRMEINPVRTEENHKMSTPQRCIGPLPLNPLDLLNKDRKSRSKTGDAGIRGEGE